MINQLKELESTMDKAFSQVHEYTTKRWAQKLLQYDPEAKQVVAGKFSGETRLGYHVVWYLDNQNNILTFIIKLV